MSITLDYLKTYEEIYITIKTNTKEFYTLVGRKIDVEDDDIEIIISCHKQRTNIIAKGYMPYLKDSICDFKVTHINKDDVEVIFLHTNVKEKIEYFLNKLNSIEYTIEDQEY